MKVKTGIASRFLKPNLAIVDPTTTLTMSSSMVAATGFDVLSHALESYTARPYTRRVPLQKKPSLRPLSQGANPYSDIGCREAIKLCGKYIVRASNDKSDIEAREQMMFAASLAGIA